MSVVQSLEAEKPIIDLDKQENDLTYDGGKGESGIQTAESDLMTSNDRTTMDDGTEFSESLLLSPPKEEKVMVTAWDPEEGEISNPNFLRDEPIQSSNIGHKSNHFGDISTIEHDGKHPNISKSEK